MLTIFSTPKPMHDDEVMRIQKNAFFSWSKLSPNNDVHIFAADEKGVDVARGLGFNTDDQISFKAGLPRLASLFERGAALGSNDVLMYVNADIVFLDDFMPVVQKVAEAYQDKPFLMVGQRWNLILEEDLDVFSGNWCEHLRREVKERGRLSPGSSIDYFVFPKGLWKQIPDFTVGRIAFDNWLIYEARRLGADVIDLSPTTVVVHQHHEHFATNDSPPRIVDQKAYKEFMWKRRKSPEAKEQIKLAGGISNLYTIDHSNKEYTENGIVNKDPSRMPKTGRLEKIKAMLKPLKAFLKKLYFGTTYNFKKASVMLLTKGGANYNEITMDGFVFRDASVHGIVQYLFFGGDLEKLKTEVRKVSEVLDERGRQSPVIFDIGASIGRNSMFYSRIPDSKVYSFEPIKLSYDFLCQNIENNSLGNVQAFNQGFSDKHESLLISPPDPDQHEWYGNKVGLDRPSLSSVYSTNKKSAQEAEFFTVDEFVDSEQIPKLDFVKIDVEGHEWAVLSGAKKTIEKNRPIFQIEINQFTQAISGKSSEDILKPLLDDGYRLFYFKDGELISSAIGELPEEEMVVDAILIPEEKNL